MPGLRQELDALEPFLLRRAHFAHEGVQVPDQALHELAGALVRGAADALQDLGGERLLVEVADRHGCLLERGMLTSAAEEETP